MFAIQIRPGRSTLKFGVNPRPHHSQSRQPSSAGFQWPSRHGLLSLILAASLALSAAPQAGDPVPDAAGLQHVREYIKSSWRTLERSNLTILRSAADSKVGQADTLVLYVARDEDPARIRADFERQLSPAELSSLDIRQLPEDPETIAPAGLLYLPYPYVVPGGRFNEMYGWDSYFTLLGLVRDGEMDLAKDMTENFIYEIQHYGMILNANRTYYLTRSQPPFLTEMILEVYRRTGDLEWLASTVPAIGEYYKTHSVPEYDVSQFYNAATDELTRLFYDGDRAMRESGFDPSARFGPFSVDIIHYNPVDLNCLLYRMEMDMAAILTMLERQDASSWADRASVRAATINKLMWNPNAGRDRKST